MPSIGLADKITLDAVKALIGDANPVSGDLLTLFKGLKLIADYVDTLETKVGTNADGAGTSTLFARLAQLAGYTDSLESGVVDLQTSRVGAQNDPASTAGSANAKLAYIIANQPKRKSCESPATFTTSNAALQTAVNYSGAGELIGFSCRPSVAGSNYLVRITLDGNVIVYGKLTSGTTNPQVLSPTWASGAQNGSQAVMSTGNTSPNLPFKTSCKIEISGDGTNSNTCGYVLAKEG